MTFKIFRTATFAAMIMSAFLVLQSNVAGQDGGAGGVPVGGVGNGGTPDTGGAGAGGPTGSNVDTGGGEGVGDLGDAVDISTSEDQRNQGFVGATAPGIQQFGFVGAAGENSGPPLAEGATFGGGINDATASRINIAGGTAGQGGGSAATTDTGINITRRSVRSRLRQSFTAPQSSSHQVSSRFFNHLNRQPGTQNLNGRYSIWIENRTAYLNGLVETQADSDRLVRQLRLEPGIYQIVNQLEVSR